VIEEVVAGLEAGALLYLDVGRDDEVDENGES